MLLSIRAGGEGLAKGVVGDLAGPELPGEPHGRLVEDQVGSLAAALVGPAVLQIGRLEVDEALLVDRLLASQAAEGGSSLFS